MIHDSYDFVNRYFKNIFRAFVWKNVQAFAVLFFSSGEAIRIPERRLPRTQAVIWRTLSIQDNVRGRVLYAPQLCRQSRLPPMC